MQMKQTLLRLPSPTPLRCCKPVGSSKALFSGKEYGYE